MARIARVVASGDPHHITQRGVRSIPIFQTDGDRRADLDFMAEKLKRFGIEVLVWCLMTNNTHLIVVPSDAAMLSREDWAEYFKGNDEPRIQTTLQRGMRTGRPAGSEQFIEMIERLTGRDLMLRKAVRPLKRAS